MKTPLKKTRKVKSLWTAAGEDKNNNYSLKTRIHKLDDKLQQKLLWSNICTLWACIILIFIIAKIYKSFTGNHPFLLTSALALIAGLFAIFLFYLVKNIQYKDTRLPKASKTYLNYQASKLNSQLKLISGYLVTYTLIILVSGLFFSRGINNGLTLLLKMTAPTSIIVYGLGFYFISSFTRQRCTLRSFERQLDAIGFKGKIIHN